MQCYEINKLVTNECVGMVTILGWRLLLKHLFPELFILNSFHFQCSNSLTCT